MFKILKRDDLNPTIVRIVVEAPFVAKKAQPGQFVIVRANSDSERLPFTIAGEDPEKGTVTIIYQIVGAGTLELSQKHEGDELADFVGPLGRPSELEGLKHVAIIGGGAGCAIAYPLARYRIFCSIPFPFLPNLDFRRNSYRIYLIVYYFTLF